VAFSGAPRDGQNLVGITDYGPASNKLGDYTNPKGWFFAVQIQADLFGDTNPADWLATQTIATSGTVTVLLPDGKEKTVSGTIAAHDDSPAFGINTGTAGRFDWLDIPGFPHNEFGGRVITATLTDTFVSTLTHRRSGQSCSVTWSLTLTVPRGEPASWTR
jgi:hypothetical protein